MASIAVPQTWCEVMSANPSTNYSNSSRVGTFSNSEMSYGNLGKVILNFGAPISGYFSIGQIISSDLDYNPGWPDPATSYGNTAALTYIKGWGCVGKKLVSAPDPYVAIAYLKITEITEPFDVTEITWNNYSGSITTGANQILTHACYVSGSYNFNYLAGVTMRDIDSVRALKTASSIHGVLIEATGDVTGYADDGLCAFCMLRP